MGALSGVKVLDLTRAVSGPWATCLLTDMGAEVLKVEHPEVGDDTRHFMPQKNGVAGSFASLNRGKKGITLDLTKPEGQEIVKKIVPQVDILVENFTPGTMEKWGLGYETLKKINPRLIMCSISGFGQTGPLAQRPGYDIVAQAMSGLMNVNGWADGPPTKIGCLIGDFSAGQYGTIGILGALYAREKIGVGQHIDVALLDALMQYYDYPPYSIEGNPGERTGNRLPGIAPFDAFPAKGNRWIVIGCANDKLFYTLCEAMGKPEMIEDERFRENRGRVNNVVEMTRIISEWTSQYEMGQLLGILGSKGVPASPIMNFAEVDSLPQTKAREMIVEIDDLNLGKNYKVPGNCIKMSETPTKLYGSSPILGQYNEEVYGQYLGLTQEQMKELKEKRVI